MPVPMHCRETDRLESLKRTNILDTPRDQKFDRLVYTAAEIFRVPISYFSLIDTDRQWIKSSVGINFTETTRDSALCSYTILQSDMMVVEDATQDGRFLSSDLVTGAPFVRFYAGIPLFSDDGLQLGSFCIMDRYPRQMSDQQGCIMKQIAQAGEEIMHHLC